MTQVDRCVQASPSLGHELVLCLCHKDGQHSDHPMIQAGLVVLTKFIQFQVFVCEFNHSENMPGESLAVSKDVCVCMRACVHIVRV